MALIERFTPGGNLYPDGGSTFVVLVDLFRRIAENLDARQAAQKTDWEAADLSTLTAAKTDASTKATTAQANAKTYTDQAVSRVDLTGYATEAYVGLAVAGVDAGPAITRPSTGVVVLTDDDTGGGTPPPPAVTVTPLEPGLYRLTTL